jgi:hypothetical protein
MGFRVRIIRGEKNVVFEDGTDYKKEEMDLLKDVSENHLKKIHEVKKTFSGTLTKQSS